MQPNTTTQVLHPRELVITRILHATPEQVYTVWTQRLPEWWGPHGMTTPVCEMDLRPGGIFRAVMRSPDGTEYPSRGVFLELVPNQRIVFTDAFSHGWRPNPRLFFTACITLEALPHQKTRYTARALHWTTKACREHEQMGFHTGWGESLDRLEALVRRAR